MEDHFSPIIHCGVISVTDCGDTTHEPPLMIGYESLNASTKSERLSQILLWSIVQNWWRGVVAENIWYTTTLLYCCGDSIHMALCSRGACADQSIPSGNQTYGWSVAGLLEGHSVCMSTFPRSWGDMMAPHAVHGILYIEPWYAHRILGKDWSIFIPRTIHLIFRCDSIS